eukprot:9136949-Pyramimonas_sp.AAC.1
MEAPANGWKKWSTPSTTAAVPSAAATFPGECSAAVARVTCAAISFPRCARQGDRSNWSQDERGHADRARALVLGEAVRLPGSQELDVPQRDVGVPRRGDQPPDEVCSAAVVAHQQEGEPRVQAPGSAPAAAPDRRTPMGGKAKGKRNEWAFSSCNANTWSSWELLLEWRMEEVQGPKPQFWAAQETR